MDGTDSERLEDTEGSYCDESATVARSNFEQFQTAYARPLITSSIDAFHAHPWMSTFCAIFLSLWAATFLATCATLSSSPVISFLGMAVLVFASISFLFFVLTVATMTLIGVPSLILLLTMSTVILTVSLMLMALILSTYTIARLVLLLHSEGSMGLSAWIVETKAMLFGSPARSKDAVEGSFVLVDGEADVKVEGK